LFVPDKNAERPDNEPDETIALPLPSAAPPKQKRKISTGADKSLRIDIEPAEGEFGKILKKP
jgi:hypothetical protein